jgi:hypothetical protein
MKEIDDKPGCAVMIQILYRFDFFRHAPRPFERERQRRV